MSFYRKKTDNVLKDRFLNKKHAIIQLYLYWTATVQLTDSQLVHTGVQFSIMFILVRIYLDIPSQEVSWNKAIHLVL